MNAVAYFTLLNATPFKSRLEHGSYIILTIYKLTHITNLRFSLNTILLTKRKLTKLTGKSMNFALPPLIKKNSKKKKK